MKNNYFIHDEEVWIELNRPKDQMTLFTVIDLEDLPLMEEIPGKVYPTLEGKRFYARYHDYSKNPITYRLHQLLFGFLFDGYIDHINHNALDNRKTNLRVATVRENGQNREDGFSKYPGVGYRYSPNRKKHWTANININGANKFLGIFMTEIDAARAYRDACIKYNLPILQEVLECIDKEPNKPQN